MGLGRVSLLCAAACAALCRLHCVADSRHNEVYLLKSPEEGLPHKPAAKADTEGSF